MASICTNQGLQRIGVEASHVTAGGAPVYTGSRHIQTMAIDDNASAFAAAHTNLLSAGSITNEFDQAFDAAPTRASQTVTHLTTYPAGAGAFNFTIKRVSLHDDTAANVTTSSTTLVAGVDGQTLGKTVDFALAISLALLYTNVP